MPWYSVDSSSITVDAGSARWTEYCHRTDLEVRPCRGAFVPHILSHDPLSYALSRTRCRSLSVTTYLNIFSTKNLWPHNRHSICTSRAPYEQYSGCTIYYRRCHLKVDFGRDKRRRLSQSSLTPGGFVELANEALQRS